MVHWVKDLVLSLLWPWSLLWYGCNPWPGSYHMPQVQPKKERKKKRKNLLRATMASGSFRE